MIKFQLVGDAEVAAKLGGLTALARQGLRTGILRSVIKLQRHVQQDKLSGQVLHVRTGRLRRSIAQNVEASGNEITGIVSTAVSYAKTHEYGFKGTVNVRAHDRNGHPVRGHTRQVNLPERSFLRSALADFERSGVIGQEVANAIKQAIG